MTGYGQCAACGCPLSDAEMFGGEVCAACEAEERELYEDYEETER